MRSMGGTQFLPDPAAVPTASSLRTAALKSIRQEVRRNLFKEPPDLLSLLLMPLASGCRRVKDRVVTWDGDPQER